MGFYLCIEPLIEKIVEPSIDQKFLTLHFRMSIIYNPIDFPSKLLAKFRPSRSESTVSFFIEKPN